MKKTHLRWLPTIVCSGLLAVAAAGCQKAYTPPAGDFASDTFSERERTQADKILANVQTLSLDDSLLNFPPDPKLLLYSYIYLLSCRT